MTLGRRTILTDGVIDKICEAREIGGTFTICAQYAGVSYPSILEWFRSSRELVMQLEKKERDPETLSDYERQLLKFLGKIERCEANDAMNLLSVIDKAAASDPSWAEKRLKHRYPDFNVPIKQEIEIDFGKMKDDDLTRFIQEKLTELGNSASGSEAAGTEAPKPA
jgi:hypothetical protein